MKKDLFNLTIKEFTRLLLDSEETYTINLKAFFPDEGYSDDDIQGTYTQLHDFAMQLLATNPNNYIGEKMKLFIENSLFDYNMQLETLDIYNYLQYKTDNFDAIKKGILLKEIENTLSHIQGEKDYYDMEHYKQYRIAVSILEQDSTEESIKDNNPTKDSKRGRPKSNIANRMIDDEAGLKLDKLRRMIKGKKGKEVALIILACIKKGWMSRPTFSELTDEFGDIGTQQGFSNYLHKTRFSDDEIEGVIRNLNI